MTNPFRRRGLYAAIISFPMLANGLREARADSVFWAGGISADWFTDGNWVWDGHTPTAGDSARIDNGSTTGPVIAGPAGAVGELFVGVTTLGALTIQSSLASTTATLGYGAGSHGMVSVSGAAAQWTNTGNLYVGNGSSGQLDLDGGATASVGNLYLGAAAGGTGTVTLDGGSSLTTTGNFFIGYGGTGTLTVTSGLVQSNGAIVGDGFGSIGTVTVSGATSSWTNSGSLIVGSAGQGTMTISGGASVSNTDAAIGGVAGGLTSGVTVTGAGSSWTSAGTLSVGVAATAELRVEAGAVVSSQTSFIGLQSTSSATVTGTGSRWSAGALFVGGDPGTPAAASGTLNVLAGGRLETAAARLGEVAGATGAVRVDGAGSTWQATDRIGVGYFGTGTLAVTNGATVQSTGGLVGWQSGAVGTVTVSGAGSAWTNTGHLHVGNVGRGSLTVSAGGQVSGVDGYVGTEAGSASTALITGPGSAWVNSGDFFVGHNRGASGTVTIANGGRISDVQGLLGDLAGSSGTMTVTGAGSRWSNAADVNVGRFGTGSLTISDGGQVTGNRAYIGNEAGSSGTVLVTGTGSSWTTDARLFVGADGAGVMTVANGGRVAATEIVLGYGPQASGVLNLGAPAGQAPAAGGVLDTAGIRFGAGSGRLVVNVTDANTVLGQSITGPGSLTLLAGDLALTGTNSYTGGTTVAGGSLTGNSASLVGSILNNAAVTFAQPADGTYAGIVSGTGSLTKTGAGNLTLTGAHSYTGGTTVAGGTLTGTTASLQGSILNNAAVIFAQATDGTYAGSLSGTGSVTMAGGANLTFSGNSGGFAGSTGVQSGTLSVNGVLGGSLAVGAGGTLGGTGQVGTTTVASGGTLAPGNSVGTLTVGGNLTLAVGSATAIEVQGGTSDRLNVTGLAGLNGTLRLIPLGGSYGFNTPYTLVSAAGGVQGQFAATQGGFGAGIVSSVSYTPNLVQLTLAPGVLVTGSQSPGLGGPIPSNLRNAAGALDAARAAGGNLQPFFGVYDATPAQIGQAVNQLTGEVGTASTSMGLIAGQQFLSSMLNPFSYGRDALLGTRIALAGSADGDDAGAAPRPRHAMWGQATGAYSRVAGEGGPGSATRSARGAGFAIGLDVALGANSVAGVSVASGETSASLSGGLGRANAWTGQIGAYGRTRFGTPIGGLTLEGAAAISFLEVDSKRTQYFLGAAEQRASYDARVWSMRIETRHDGVVRGGVSLQPFLAVQAQVVDSDGYAEHSANAAAQTGVRVAGATNSTVRTELGGQAETQASLAGRPVRAFARVAWAHYAMREQNAAMSLIAFPGQGFLVRGARPDADSAVLALGAEAEVARGWMLGARLDSELSSRVREIAGTVRLRYAF